MTEGKKPQDRQLSRKKPRQKTLWFVTDFDMAEELEKLKSQEGLANLLGKAGEAPEQERLAKVAELETALRKSSIKIVVQSMGRRAYDDLISAHPPSPAQIEEYKDQRQKPGFNVETYPTALVVASVIEPVMSPEELKEWFDSDDWTGGEFSEIFSACIQVNSQGNILTLGKG
jgi:hypothetical protein